MTKNIINHLLDSDFFETIWQKKNIQIKNICEFKQDSVSILDEILSHRSPRIKYPQLRAFNQSQQICPLDYTCSNRQNLSHDLDIPSVFSLLNRSLTIKVTDIDQYHSWISELKKVFELFFNSLVKINAYISTSQCYGGSPHYDSHHIFIFQIHGEKHWDFGLKEIDSPHKDFPHKFIHNDLNQKIQTQEGDVLYIPPGLPHNVFTPKQSVHLSVGIHTERYFEFLIQNIKKLAETQPVLRHDLNYRINNAYLPEKINKSHQVEIMALLKNLIESL